MPAAGQIKIGDNLSLSGNGSISATYSDSYGNEIDSSHGLGFGGTLGLSGFFYNPNFLSFNVNPYYNQSRNNSTSASLTDASGVTLSSAIFSGSHFPGSVNYSTNYNSTGNYGIPGISSFDTNGNGQSFGINWSALLPNLPTLTVGYQMGSSNYSLYGTNEDGSSNFHSLYLNSNYNIAGFGLGGGISHGTSNALIPGVIVGGQDATSNSDSTSYTFSASHRLPWDGSFSSSFNRTNLNSDYLGYSFNGNIDRVAVSAGVHPTPKLSFSLGADYTDNLSGSLYQAIVPGASTSTLAPTTSGTTSGSLASGSDTAQSTALELASHAWNFLFNTSYSVATDLQLQGTYERREQTYLGQNFGSNQFDAGLFYTRAIMGGYLGSAVNIIDSTIDGSAQNQLGFSVNTNYNRHIGLWQVGGYFNYAQNAQTFLVTYTASFYNFSGNVSRRFGKWYWTGNAGGGRSGLTAVPGSSSSGESFGTSLGNGKINVSGNYSKSDGNSLASGGGLNPTPLPPIIPSSLLVLYGGESYSFALSGSPTRHLLASASYVKSRSNLNNLGITSWNNYEQQNLYLQYQFRQIGVNGGYTRLVQGFSASGTAPASFSSFSIGVYRWFNFF
jgi:hypothetical protein